MAVDPAFLLMPEYDYTLGGEVAAVCELAGFVPDETQRLVLDGVFAERGGMPAAREVGLVGGRQNYKSGALEMVALGWLFVTMESRITWSAHRTKTMRVSFEHLVGLISGCPSLSRHVGKITDGRGSELVEMSDGRSIEFIARTLGGGRGQSSGKHIWDEDLFATATHEGTLLPTMSTFPDAQRVRATSAGLPMSVRSRSLRDRGRPMDRVAEPSLFYIEFCDDLPGECERGEDCTHLYGTPGCRFDDEARWYRANPALGSRITVEYVRQERRSLSPHEFGRERLGYWDEPAGSEQVNDPAAWHDCEDGESRIADRPVFALDVAPMSDWAAITVAGANGSGRTHVEISAEDVGGVDPVLDYRAGVGWVVPRLADMASRHAGFEIHMVAGSSAEALRPALERAGVTVTMHPFAAFKQSCVHFHAQLHSKALAHFGQVELTGAVLAGGKRSQADGLWAWGRQQSQTDICPLNAGSLAVWLAQESAYDPVANIF